MADFTLTKSDGRTYGWCSECKGWWVVLTGLLRTHRVWDGTVAPRCSGSGAEPTSPGVGLRTW